MKHNRPVTVNKAIDDSAGAIFFQIWLSVFLAIITGAFGSKE